MVGGSGMMNSAVNKVAAEKTALERALGALPPTAAAEKALDTINTLTRNVVQKQEEKYRTVKLSNPKIQELLVRVPGAVDAMKVMGWVEEEGELLVLPAGVKLSMSEVRAIEDAKIAQKKAQDEEMKKRLASKKRMTPEQAALKAQIEADKAERLAAGPVTKGSEVVKKTGPGAMVTAGDLGLNKSSGG
mmetsp:Transcript_16573/g.54114  ORF Transcript_16573/g.54114 Transcript_16573/m.54114 type:complete len:189 (-) Transcript_16573:1696-2262(-)